MGWAIEPRDGAIVITMNSNPVNKMNPEFFDDLHAAFDRVDREQPRCPIVLTGQGTTFSAGLDFDHAFPLFARNDASAILRWFARFRDSIVRVFSSPQRVVAAVNGNAYAGGLILALCCEHRVAVAGSGRFTLNEVAIGIPMPHVYVEIVRHAVGTRVAAELMLDCRPMDSKEALSSGLVHRLVDGEQLIDAAVAEARLVNADTYDAYRVSKDNLRRPTLNLITDAVEGIDQAALDALMTPEARRAHAAAYERLKTRAKS
jgi:enoyl-CoA hydratase/carnithine racemase